MECFWNVYRKFTVFSLALFLSQISSAEKLYQIEDLPRNITNAVRPSTIFLNSDFKQGLDKTLTGKLRFEVQLQTLNDFFIYEDSLKIEALEDPALKSDPWTLEILKAPTVSRFLDPISKKLKTGYRGDAVFLLEANLPQKGIAPLDENHPLPFKVHFQACSKSQCLLPIWVEMHVAIGGNAAPENNGVKVDGTFSFAKLSDKLKALINENGAFGIESFLILFLAGLLAAFTPCVYPLYPITLGIFGKWSRDLHFSPFFLVLSYCLGMTLSYAIAGLISVASGTLFASLTQTPGFLLTIGTLILLSSIFFSGVWEFPMPHFIQNRVNRFSGELSHKSLFSSLASSFAMGSTLGIVASPCVGPVLVALLAWLSSAFANEEHSYFEGFILLSGFGAGMSLPFLVLGHLILRTRKKIQLGKWTPHVKLLGTIVLALSSLFFLLPGIQLLLKSDTPPQASFTVFNLENSPTDKWLLIDFRADWCTACLKLERETFNSERIVKELQSHWAYVQVDFTEMNEAKQKIAEEYQVISLPTVLFKSPQGTICTEETLHEFETPSVFLERLERARRNCH